MHIESIDVCLGYDLSLLDFGKSLFIICRLLCIWSWYSGESVSSYGEIVVLLPYQD